MAIAKTDRIEITIVLTSETLEQLEKVTERLKITRHSLLQMLFSKNDIIAKNAFETIQKIVHVDKDEVK